MSRVTTDQILKMASEHHEGYPYDFGAVARAMPTFTIPLQMANPNTFRRDMPVDVDCDESGLIAVHKGLVNGDITDQGYTVTHPPSGVAYLQNLTLVEAMDLGNYLSARLHRIEQLVIDSTTPDPKKQGVATIIKDPGDVNGIIAEWIKNQDRMKRRRKR